MFNTVGKGDTGTLLKADVDKFRRKDSVKRCIRRVDIVVLSVGMEMVDSVLVWLISNSVTLTEF